MTKHLRSALFSLAALALAAAPHLANAQLTNPLGTSDLRLVIGRVVQTLLGISGALALLMFVWGGMLWMTSGGSEDRVKKGKQTLTWAVIGLVVIFTSYTLVGAVIRAITSGSVS